MREIPVYFFTGFLGAGKTTFLKETLESPEFGNDGRTLLLICERGETEYEPDKFAGPGVRVEQIKTEDELNEANLRMIAASGDFDRVVVEYNGMWENQKFFTAMPEGWLIAQEMALFDASMFMMYNRNMRQLCFNKMQTADMVVFNRCEKGFDKMPFHKEVRIANRRNMIVYEYGPNDIEPDDIEDPLPYDMTKSRIKIEDDWYAEWYRDINEEPEKYDGKRVHLKAMAAMNPKFPKGTIALGRKIMTCCVEDITFCWLASLCDEQLDLTKPKWFDVTFTVKMQKHKLYKGKGPVLVVEKLTPAEAPLQEVATFY